MFTFSGKEKTWKLMIFSSTQLLYTDFLAHGLYMHKNKCHIYNSNGKCSCWKIIFYLIDQSLKGRIHGKAN